MKITTHRTLVLTAVALITVSFVAPARAKLISLPNVGPGDFVSVIDNTYFPLTPGTTLVYQSDEDEVMRSEFAVTHNTRAINGITCVEVHDVARVFVADLQDWVLIEDTLDWFAQDIHGNVWYFGESTVEYVYDDEWNVIGTSTAGSWEAGVNGATAGIVMMAAPRSGRSYPQERAVGVAQDMAKVLRLNARVSVEHGDFDHCLMTKEWTPLEPGHIEHKYYAPGVGLVLVKEHHGRVVRVQLVDAIVE